MRYRIEWKIQGRQGHGEWHKTAQELAVRADAMNNRFGAGTHRVIGEGQQPLVAAQAAEIAALKAESIKDEASAAVLRLNIHQMEVMLAGLQRMVIGQEKEISALQAERDALREDAGRYRFLRAQPIEGEAGQPVVAMPNGMSSGYYLNEETADFAIDAAMQAQQKSQNDRN